MRYIFIFMLISIWQNPIDLKEGLVAHYSFDDCKAIDELGTSPGYLFGNVSCWCGVDGQGLLFDGISGSVSFEGKVNKYFSTSDFTVSYYFKSESFAALPQTLLSKREACDQQNMLDFWLSQTLGEVEAFVYETENRFYPELIAQDVVPGWHHIALVREGVFAYLYLDGALRAKAARCRGVDLSNQAPLGISNSPCIQAGKAIPFKGVIDELYVFSRALTEDEVEALYLLHPITNAKQDCDF